MFLIEWQSLLRTPRYQSPLHQSQTCSVSGLELLHPFPVSRSFVFIRVRTYIQHVCIFLFPEFLFKFIISIFSNNIFILIVGTCVVFTYLWHITFFGACMAIAGYAEKDNRHAMTCLRVVPKSLASKLISCENVKNDNIGYIIFF